VINRNHQVSDGDGKAGSVLASIFPCHIKLFGTIVKKSARNICWFSHSAVLIITIAVFGSGATAEGSQDISDLIGSAKVHSQTIPSDVTCHQASAVGLLS
jgi:hypothetical protein